MSWFRVIWEGIRRGVLAWARLMLVIVPVYTGMALLKYVGILPRIADLCRPAMKYFGLPGDTALALVLGNFLNLYSAMGVIASLKLTPGQMTILSLMLLISHSQILESSVFFQIRTKYQVLWAIRLVTALLAGWGLHFLIAPGKSGTVPACGLSPDFPVPKTQSLAQAASDYGLGLLGLAWKMLAILAAIFLVLEIVKRLSLLERSLKALNRFTRFMGYSERAGLPWLAGVIFGIVFGAGVITGSVREQQLEPKQVLLVSVFLALCHGVIEDTGLMLVLGANLFWITVPRVLLAVPVTWFVNRLYQPKPAIAGLKPE